MLEYFPKSNSNVCLVSSDEIKQCKLMIKLVSYGGYASECVSQAAHLFRAKLEIIFRKVILESLHERLCSKLFF